MAKALGSVALLGLASTFAGCATQVRPLYDWGGYQAALYEHLKNPAADPRAQIDQLEAQLQATADGHAAVPPGLHAHLALLYSQVGDDGAALAHLQTERRLFPESAVYVDFLLKNARLGAARS